MSNIIRLNETAPNNGWIVMSNQGMDCFLDLLITAADVFEKTEHQKKLISFLKDQKGIIAYVTRILADNGINILDISQTLMQEYFAMIMLVDTTDCELSFDALSALLKEKGAEKNLSIQIQREDIFNSMHKI